MTRIRFPRRREPNPEGRMSVMDHLRELRRRVVWALVIIACGAVLGYVFYDQILAVLKHPYCSVPADHRLDGLTDGGKSCKLIFNGPLDGFTSRLKISFIAGTVITAPLWLYQLWAFITPGLRENEKKYTRIFMAAATLLFFSGVALAYVVLAKGLRILIEQGGNGTAALLTINSYLSFVVLMLVVFGSAFLLPLVVVMANLAGVLPAKLLRKSQRLAIFLIFLFAAVATPSTDPFTMCAMAVPMVLLFEGAVLLATVHDRRKARRKAAELAAKQWDESIDDETPSRIDPIPSSVNASWSETT